MKTKELIKRVEELGFEVEYHKEKIGVLEALNEFGELYYGSVNKTEWKELNIAKHCPLEVFDLLVEYAKTPIKDREEKKMFYIRPKGMDIYKQRVFNYFLPDNTWFMSSETHSDNYKTQFTLKELEELGIDVNHYDLEEVE